MKTHLGIMGEHLMTAAETSVDAVSHESHVSGTFWGNRFK